MISPKISIIIPVYNCEIFLQQAIDSVKSQNYSSFEIIVVDDGSDDGSAQIAKANNDVIYLFQENKGVATARNKGLTIATGTYIIFLDSDDFLEKNSMNQLAEYLNLNSEVEIVDGLVQDVNCYDNNFDYEINSEPYHTVLLGSKLIRKSVFEKVGIFDERLLIGQDVDWMIRAWEKGIEKRRLNCKTFYYRRHKNNITNNRELNIRYRTMLFYFKAIRERTNGVNKHSNESLIGYLGNKSKNIMHE